MLAGQQSLLGWEEPAYTLARGKRLALDGSAWLDVYRGAVAGHAALFQELADGFRWRTMERRMYERTVAVPRLLAGCPEDGTLPPVLDALRLDLSARYRVDLCRVSLALYRDGRDSVAWHRDRELRDRATGTVAVLSLGGPRRFQLRPFGHKRGPARRLTVGGGDLVVMGGTCQRTWEHAVPKMGEARAARAAPRIALMLRPD